MQVILKCEIKDIESLQELPEFENVWSYYPEDPEVKETEWGRIKTENFIFKILVDQPERSKREDFADKCNHENDFKEYRDINGCCFDPSCCACRQRCGALNTMET